MIWFGFFRLFSKGLEGDTRLQAGLNGDDSFRPVEDIQGRSGESCVDVMFHQASIYPFMERGGVTGLFKKGEKNFIFSVLRRGQAQHTFDEKFAEMVTVVANPWVFIVGEKIVCVEGKGLLHGLRILCIAHPLHGSAELQGINPAE